MTVQRSHLVATSLAVIAAALGSALVTPAKSHPPEVSTYPDDPGNPDYSDYNLIRVCVPGTSETGCFGSGPSVAPGPNDANSATCAPSLAPSFACTAPSSVTIWTKGWAAGETLRFWWLNATTDASPGKFDCSQAETNDLVPRRTLLGTVTVASGATSAKLDLTSALPPNNFPGMWTYGTNWVCVTSVDPLNPSGGNSGDQVFIVRPTG